MDNKAREINSPLIQQLIDETTPEELAKIDTDMTNNKQQTAVEFYLDKVFDIIGDAILDKLSIEQINKIHDLSLQAKEMEKEQIITAFWNGDNTDCTSEQNVKDFAEQYYNETYGGSEQ
jgi:hypothetical protein